jgi:hypothetical protein
MVKALLILGGYLAGVIAMVWMDKNPGKLKGVVKRKKKQADIQNHYHVTITDNSVDNVPIRERK